MTGVPQDGSPGAPQSGPAFQIGRIQVHGDLILAPMDGYSDQPYRSICRELGSAVSYTEFVNALDILQGHPYVHEKLKYLPEERPVIFQLFDSDPDRLLEVALRLQELEPDGIDINLGCSARNVSGRGAGAGLLKTPHKIALIFQKLVSALSLPVTAKIRLGWDEKSRNYLQVARLLEENGAAALAVHGRTKAQGYGGQADWEAIAAVRQAVSIPVIANGDVRTTADIARIKAQTGCAAVMIGRAAIGNPWIFSRLDRQDAPPELVRATMERHLERMLAFYGSAHGLVWFRKHAERYLRPYALPVALRQQLLTADRLEDFWALVERSLK